MRRDRGRKTGGKRKRERRETEWNRGRERETGREKETLNPEYRNTQDTRGMGLRSSNCISLTENPILFTFLPRKLFIAILTFKIKGYF